MKQVLTHACRPASFGWGYRLLAWLRGRGETHRAIGPKPLSDHMLHDIGLSDDAHGDQLYGMARRRW
jgi:hypothetical protein